MIAEENGVPGGLSPSVAPTLATSAAGAAGSLAGWAISSLGKKACASIQSSRVTSLTRKNAACYFRYAKRNGCTSRRYRQAVVSAAASRAVCNSERLSVERNQAESPRLRSILALGSELCGDIPIVCVCYSSVRQFAGEGHAARC